MDPSDSDNLKLKMRKTKTCKKYIAKRNVHGLRRQHTVGFNKFQKGNLKGMSTYIKSKSPLKHVHYSATVDHQKQKKTI